MNRDIDDPEYRDSNVGMGMVETKKEREERVVTIAEGGINCRSVRQATSIEIGDRVDVHFENVAYLHDVEVLYFPTAQGEAWILRDNDGRVHYVQNYARMSQRYPK